MKEKPAPLEILSKVPVRVFERLVKDLPAESLAEILKENPSIRKDVLGGFSLRPKNIAQTLSSPVTIARLQRRLHGDMQFFNLVLDVWCEESTAMSYLSMLDGDFVLARWKQLRDLLGPERFFLGLFALEAFEDERYAGLLEKENFWTPAPDRTMYELFLLPLSVWSRFAAENPELAEKLDQDMGREMRGLLGIDWPRYRGEQPAQASPPVPEPTKKFEKKLQKKLDDLANANEQLSAFKTENEGLRKKLKELEADFNQKLRDSAAELKGEMFVRYRGIEPVKLAADATRLTSLVERTKRALELQARSDEEYGLISEIRARLLEVDLSLDKIESVFANSLVVHKEVEKVKQALLDEKKHILSLPGIGRVVGKAHSGPEGELAGRINLIDPVPATLPNLDKLRSAVEVLSRAGLFGEASEIEEAIRHKRKQVLDGIYSRFVPRGDALKRGRPLPRTLDEFVKSGESRRYDIFVDGYNVLLRAHGENEELVRQRFTELREGFVAKVIERAARFSRLYLVFDGIENSREVRGNTEIIFTDNRQRSADAVIIEKISARKDKKILLVTADEDIIAKTRDRVFALIDPIDFYMFVFE